MAETGLTERGLSASWGRSKYASSQTRPACKFGRYKSELPDLPFNWACRDGKLRGASEVLTSANLRFDVRRLWAARLSQPGLAVPNELTHVKFLFFGFAVLRPPNSEDVGGTTTHGVHDVQAPGLSPMDYGRGSVVG